MIRWGLCCLFAAAPIRFRTATHRYVSGLDGPVGRRYLGRIAAENAAALLSSVDQCRGLGIGAFRINSQVLPLGTHPESGYTLTRLDRRGTIRAGFRAAGERAAELGVRLSFHPDQFVVLNSERETVAASAVEELEFQAGLAELVGADVIVLHGGGAASGTQAALARLERGVGRLSARARGRLALKNDDRSFTPSDLLPLCGRLGVPLVYDVHHHRCKPDGLDVAEATRLAAGTWNGREPYFHISSPRNGWSGGDPKPHADYVDLRDFPDAWRGLALTVDGEAKAKERAVVALMKEVTATRGASSDASSGA